MRLGRGAQRGAGPGGAGAGIIGSGFVEVMQEGKLGDDEAEHERTHAGLLALGARLRRLEAALEAKAALDARLEAKLDRLLAGAGQPVPGLPRAPPDDGRPQS